MLEMSGEYDDNPTVSILTLSTQQEVTEDAEVSIVIWNMIIDKSISNNILYIRYSLNLPLLNLELPTIPRGKFSWFNLQ